MPFEESLKEIYTEIYAPVCAARGIDCSRVDEIARPGSITKDIIEGILDSDIIIADLSGRNPNVFYELGIAHASGNKTIMTSQTIDDVPFDIRNYRVVVYERTLTGCKKLTSDLGKAIDELLAALDVTNNPFQEVVSNRVSVRLFERESLAQHLNFSRLPDKIVEFFQKNNVHQKEDLTVDLFDKMAKTPKIGRVSLGRLCSALLRDPYFLDLTFLNDFILRYKLDTTRFV